MEAFCARILPNGRPITLWKDSLLFLVPRFVQFFKSRNDPCTSFPFMCKFPSRTFRLVGNRRVLPLYPYCIVISCLCLIFKRSFSICTHQICRIAATATFVCVYFWIQQHSLLLYSGSPSLLNLVAPRGRSCYLYLYTQYAHTQLPTLTDFEFVLEALQLNSLFLSRQRKTPPLVRQMCSPGTCESKLSQVRRFIPRREWLHICCTN